MLYNIDVIIMAAGSGTRFGSTSPKCLSEINGETVISRLLRQIDNHIPNATRMIVVGFGKDKILKHLSPLEDFIVFDNERYKEDRNIYSSYIAMSESSRGTLIVEGDCIFEDEVFKEMAASIKDESLFFLGNEGERDRKNAIARVTDSNKIDSFIYGDRDCNVDSYHNMIGAVWIAEKNAKRYKKDLEEYCSKSLDFYYFQPIVDNLNEYELSGYIIDNKDGAYTFNTSETYAEILNQIKSKYKVKLVDTDSLRHIEDFSIRRVSEVKEKILSDGVWTRPICISREGLVMDGQHRFEVALELGIKQIPAIEFDYNDIEIYSLRSDEEVTVDLVIERAMSNNIYPYKTVKHVFPEEVLICNYDIKELINGNRN